MAQYRALINWRDIQDSDHEYRIGDAYPREGMLPSVARIKELSSSKNKAGQPCIEEVKDIEETKGTEEPKVDKEAKKKKK